MSDVWKDVWASLRSAGAGVLGVLASIAALMGSLYDPGIQVRFGLIWLVCSLLLVATILAACINFARETRRKALGPLPRVVAAITGSREDGRTAPATLATTRSRQFGFNMLVTVYYEERLAPGSEIVFEREIGVGRVINVQQNGLIQVRS